MYDELSEVIEYLKSIADRFDIEYFWPSALSPSTPPAAKPSKKRIVMNPNWHNAREIPFQFAHEIAHILNTQINYVNFILDNDLDSSYIPVLQKVLYTKSRNMNY